MFKKIISILIVSMMLIPNLSVGFAIDNVAENKNVEREEIQFLKEDKSILPNQITKILKKMEDEKPNAKLVESKVVVYRLIKNSDGKVSVVDKKSFDFRESENISLYNEYIEVLETVNIQSKVNEIGILSMDPGEEGAISVGLNVFEYDDPNNAHSFQAHGWWEWMEGYIGIYDPTYDTFGLVWSGQTTSDISSQSASANNIYTGNSISTDDINNDDHSCLYEQTGGGTSTGVVLSQITTSFHHGETFNIYYTYTHLNYRPNRSYWEDFFGTFVGWFLRTLPMPPQEAFPFEVKATRSY
ncbi:MAG: hypothetical protein U9Q80_08785 [Bacillota bacterium]|nr:hypothetical protein [Bacillota bacterium]